MGWVAGVAPTLLHLGFCFPCLQGTSSPTNIFLALLEVLLSSEAAAPRISAIC